MRFAASMPIVWVLLIAHPLRLAILGGSDHLATSTERKGGRLHPITFFYKMYGEVDSSLLLQIRIDAINNDLRKSQPRSSGHS
jgi:hypothetical protein